MKVLSRVYLYSSVIWEVDLMTIAMIFKTGNVLLNLQLAFKVVRKPVKI